MEKEISKTTPEQLQALNSLIERWMDAVGRRDFEEIGALFEQHHVAPGGALEQVTARLMGLGFMPPPIDNYELMEQAHSDAMRVRKD